MERGKPGAWIAAVFVGACASDPIPETAAQREPPLPAYVIETALAQPSGEDGGIRAQYLSMLGREDLFEEDADLRVCAPLMRDSTAVDPVDEIARRAADARIVIINEAHDRPQHRAFIADVASRLRADGFSIYAAETFLPAAREDRDWPSLRDGFYSAEPVFGMLLRRARSEGYSFAEYDSWIPGDATPEEQIAWREAMQARNLQRVLNDNPNARVLIHVGYGHLLEQPDSQGREWMALRLKEATGIDPLTVHTINAAPSDDFVFCDPEPTRLTHVDIRIGSPRLTFENGRPAWRQRAGQRTIAVPRELLTSAPYTIVEARIASEPDDAVPVDRVLLRSGETLPLLLAPGVYRIESWTQEGGWSAPVELSVN